MSSFYFAIVGTKDNPIFEHEFGSSKHGGDGVSRFPEQARHMNQFIVHSSLDIVEEVQWGTGLMYLKVIDRFYNNYVSCFLTGGNIKFLLLHAPNPTVSTPYYSNPSSSSSVPGGIAGSSLVGGSSSTGATAATANPTAPATEEAIRQFFMDVYDVWVKNLMNPFYTVNMDVKSPVFRARVAAAGRKYL